MIKDFSALLELVKGTRKKNVVVAASDDAHTLEAISKCVKDGLIDYTLIGDKSKTYELCEKIGFELDDEKVIHAKSREDSAKAAVSLIKDGRGDCLMKGGLETATLLKEVVDKERGIRTGGVMSHIAVIQSPSYHKLFAATDGGMMMYPDLNQKSAILKNAVDFFAGLGYEKPVASVLCAVEVLNPKMKETVDAHELKKMSQDGFFGSCIVEGPISFDLAVSRESGKIKQYESPASENTDIFLFPEIAACNIFTKGLLYMGNAKMAGCVVGAKVPIALLSRSASAEEKYLSLALCAAYKNS